MNQIEFYVDTVEVLECIDRRDLGDSGQIRIWRYPHRDMLPALTKVKRVEESYEKLWKAFVSLQKGEAYRIATALGIAVRALERIEGYNDKDILEVAKIALNEIYTGSEPESK